MLTLKSIRFLQLADFRQDFLPKKVPQEKTWFRRLLLSHHVSSWSHHGLVTTRPYIEIKWINIRPTHPVGGILLRKAFVGHVTLDTQIMVRMRGYGPQ